MLASSGGTAIVGIIVALFLIGAAYTLYSRRGGGIDAHPVSSEAAPGADDDAGLHDPDREAFRSTFDDRGTR